MDSYKITVRGQNKILSDEDVQLFIDYLSGLYTNGQISSTYQIYQREYEMFSIIDIYDIEAIDEKNNSSYTNKYHQALLDKFDIVITYYGENVCTKTACTCIEPSGYVLCSYNNDLDSPIACLDCGNPVPLYKLPYLNGQDTRDDITSWQRAYINMDDLFMLCLNDRFTYRQLNNPLSSLAKSGLEICKQLKEVTKKPVYYDIYAYNNNHEVCPICKKAWKKRIFDDEVALYCDECYVIEDEIDDNE